MNVIIFGGSGFLGSHTADVLTEDGHKVKIFDMIESPYLQTDQEMIIGDILDRKSVEKAVKGCDVVYNFAAMTDIEEAHKNPLDTIEKNILGNAVILDACRKNKSPNPHFSSNDFLLGMLTDRGVFAPAGADL